MDVIKKLNDLKRQNNLNNYRLAKICGLPQATLSNIFTRHAIAFHQHTGKKKHCITLAAACRSEVCTTFTISFRAKMSLDILIQFICRKELWITTHYLPYSPFQLPYMPNHSILPASDNKSDCHHLKL